MRKQSKLVWVVVAVAAIAAVAAAIVIVVVTGSSGAADASAAAVPIAPHDPAVAATERSRLDRGAQTLPVTLVAAATTIRVGSRELKTWAFNGSVPGPEISLRAGDVLQARVENDLPAPLTIHWHGIALRNDMDGVDGLTQKAIEPGGVLTYKFVVSDPGTFFYHSHMGTQLDRGLYGPLIVQPRTPESQQRAITLMLDDWVDGTGRTPNQILAKLRRGSSMGSGSMPGMDDMGGGMNMGGGMDTGGSMSMSTKQHPLGTDTSDATYPYYVINGRPPTSPPSYTVRPGEQIRLRLINAASNTPFRVALGGGRLTVVATDGFSVKPVTADTLLIAMGERYDVLVTVPRAGVFPLVARVEGKNSQALAVLRAGAGPTPSANVQPKELDGRLLTYADLHATAADALPAGKPDLTYTVALTGNMQSYNWAAKAPETGGATLPVRVGQKVRLVLVNRTMMWHPIHLHGHTFQLVTGNGTGPRKDTVIVPPMGRATVDVVADNPGQWLLHCHNIYHAVAGMVTQLSYVK